MIYLFHGSDAAKTRAKAFAWVRAAREKAPDAAYFRLTPEQISPEALEEVMLAQGLFMTRSLVLLDDPFAESASAETVLEALARLAASGNPVAILAPKLAPPRAKKIEAVAAKTFRADAPEKKVRGFNTALVNALAAQDRVALWTEILKAMRAGDAPEMIHGLLHWKARDLMQKGTPAQKAYARALSRSLIELLSDSRGRDLPLSLALERFALGL